MKELQQRYSNVPKEFVPFIEKDGKTIVRSARRSTVVHKDLSGENKIFRFKISTSQLDRYNDVVVPKGGDFTFYKSNPVVLWNHNSWGLPAIGKGDGLEVDETDVYCDGIFHGLTEISSDVVKLVDAGFLHSTSVGFIPLAVLDRQPNEGEILYPSWTNSVLEFQKWELLEWSVVNIPANPGAVIQNSFYEDIRHAMDSNVLNADSAVVKWLGSIQAPIVRNTQTVRQIKKVRKMLTEEQINDADALIAGGVETFVKDTLVNDYQLDEAKATAIAQKYVEAGSAILKAELANTDSTAEDSADTSTTEDTTTTEQQNSFVQKAGNRNNTEDQTRINEIARLIAELGATNITLNETPPEEQNSFEDENSQEPQPDLGEETSVEEVLNSFAII